MVEKADYEIYKKRIEVFKISLIGGIASAMIVSIPFLELQGIEVEWSLIRILKVTGFFFVLLVSSIYIIDKYLQRKKV